MKRSGSMLIYVLLAIGIASGILLLKNSFSTPQERDLFALADGLISTSSYDEASALFGAPIPIPHNALGATIYRYGIYTQQTTTTPKNTIVIVYEINRQRTFELLIKPGITLEQEKNRLSGAQTVRVGERTALLKNQDRSIVSCIKPDAQNIGVCELTTQLFFEKEGLLFILSSDGSFVSAGELIVLARSIP